MGLKDYAKKKIIKVVGKKVVDIATVGAVATTVHHIDKQNEANSLSEKNRKTGSNTDDSSSVTDPISNKSFFEEPSTYRLTMLEKTMSLRKSYVINDSAGNAIYTAKSEGLPKMPEMGLYNINGDKIGKAEKDSFTKSFSSPIFKLNYKDKRIASVYQKYSFKPKYEISENGWRIEGGITKTTVYDSNDAIAIQIQYVISTNKGTIIIEYTNKENEIPAILIALAMIIEYHM